MLQMTKNAQEQTYVKSLGGCVVSVSDGCSITLLLLLLLLLRALACLDAVEVRHVLQHVLNCVVLKDFRA
jgi:hypothetical protein